MRELWISENEAGQRLDKLLGKYLREAPKSFLYKMLRKKNIVLNGKKATGQEKLVPGDCVKLFLAEETITKFSGQTPAAPALSAGEEPEILYEDAHMLLFNKPVGMLSQKAKESDVSAVEILIAYLLRSGQLTASELKTFRPSVCNRLDRNTSGILAAGKSLAGLQELSRLFQERSLAKYYLCLVKGRVEKESHLAGYLMKEKDTNRVQFQTEKHSGWSLIETEYRPLAVKDDVTLLEVHLITGKTHQIRAHLAGTGHPLIGDYKYGDRKLNDEYKRRFGITHQLLHAYRLEMPELDGVLREASNKVFFADPPALFQMICRDRGIVLPQGTERGV